MAELTITKDNFEKAVLNADKPVLLDFWASWCGPCRMLAPVVEEIAEEYAGRAVVGKINVDDEPQLATKFCVESIPMIVVMNHGKITGTAIGFRPKAQLTKLLDEQL